MHLSCFAYLLMLSAAVPASSLQAASLVMRMPSSQFERFIHSSSQKQSDEPPACPAAFTDSLETNGIAQKMRDDPSITPPRLIHSVVAKFPKEARSVYRNTQVGQPGLKSTISLVADKNGDPTNLCVKVAGGYGLDREAAKAARQHRFKPAMKDGQPISARVNVEVRFRLYDW
jgi:TonB family protein